MQPSIQILTQQLHLDSGESLERGASKTFPSDMVSWLHARQIHEFGDSAETSGNWRPPLTMLGGLAMQLAPVGTIVWVGRRCWPTFQLFQQENEDRRAGLVRHLFLDPLTEKERLWSVMEAARCPAVRVVIADAGGMHVTAARRLQLAAEAGESIVLLARPPSELSEPSWATTRWQVRPLVSSTGEPRWSVALVRVTGGQQGQDASRQWTISWTYEVFRGAGTLSLSPALGRGTDQPKSTDAPRQIA